MTKDKEIRNSTVDFLIFTKQSGEDGINVHVEDETVWITVESIAKLFDKARSTIVEHIQKIYSTGELDRESTCRKFRHMGENGQPYWPQFYNLTMNDEKLLEDKGTVSHDQAKLYAESEFEKYRLIQDAIFQSDFDLFAKAIE